MIARAFAIVLVTVLTALAVAAAAYWGPSNLAALGGQGAATESRYRTAQIERGTIAKTVAAAGTLQAVATIRVGTQVSGQIAEILADFNAEVKQGEVIARLDPLSFQSEVEKSRAEIGIAEAALAKARVTLQEAQDDAQRKEKLTRKGAGSVVDLAKAKAARATAAAEVQNADAAVAKAKALLEQSRLDLARTQIRSPVDGVVIQRAVEQGQTVAAELQAPTLFVIAQDLRDMQVELSVDEADIGNVARGQKVTFTVDTFPGRVFWGEVVQIRKYPVVKENVTTYVVVASAPNPDLVLIPGLTALATIELESKDDVLKVPRAALRFRPENTPFSGPAVWLLRASRPVEQRVNVGLADAGFVEVNGPIEAGETVVVGLQPKAHADTARWTFRGLK